MTKYLLLRDNKQTGPFVLDELRANGLKPYDLVWIEGKSAAWRYPSEVEELMPFAPVVEEQPFDRFYKKPSQAVSSINPAINTIAQSNNVTAAQSRAVASAVTGETSTVPGKKIIYVTMPAGKAASSPYYKETAGGDKVSAGPDKGSVVPAAEGSVIRHKDDRFQPLYSAPAAVEDFSLPVQNRKESVEIAPRPRKTGWSRPLQLAVVCIGIVFLLASGIFIGLSINKNDLGLTHRLAAKDVSANSPQQSAARSVSAPPPTVPVTKDPAPPVVQSAVPVMSPATTPAATTVKPSETTVSKPKKQPVSNGKVLGSEQPKALMASASKAFVKDSATAMTTLPIVQREASHRTDAAEGVTDKDALKPNIANLVSVSANGYVVGTFGGISDLQLTVSNHSTFPLDLVVVEVQYIQANKKVFKTESLNFHNIGAGSALMLEAPKTPRGIKVQYRIKLINSKESGLSYSAI